MAKLIRNGIFRSREIQRDKKSLAGMKFTQVKSQFPKIF